MGSKKKKDEKRKKPKKIIQNYVLFMFLCSFKCTYIS